MAALTLRFSGVEGSQGFAAENVFALGHGFQVVRVYAKPHSTEMTEVKPGWYWADAKLVGDSVCQAGAVAKRDRAVARVLMLATQPTPAS